MTTTCGILKENSLDFIENKWYRVRHKGTCLITEVPYNWLDMLPKLIILKRCINTWGPKMKQLPWPSSCSLHTVPPPWIIPVFSTMQRRVCTHPSSAIVEWRCKARCVGLESRVEPLVSGNTPTYKEWTCDLSVFTFSFLTLGCWNYSPVLPALSSVSLCSLISSFSLGLSVAVHDMGFVGLWKKGSVMKTLFNFILIIINFPFISKCFF